MEQRMKIKDTEIKIVQGDITELKVDAIVNAANNELVMGGGVAGAIKKKGGKVIEDEAVKKGPIEIGDAVATSAGKLPAKYVIHAATMALDFSRHANKIEGGIPPASTGDCAGKTDEVKIRNSCKNALRVAEELKIKSIAFPALGCGVGGFPLLASAKIMSQEVFRHIKEDGSQLKEVIFCLYDKEAFDIFNKGIISYLEYIIYKLQNGPFTTVDAIIEVGEGIVFIKRSNPPFGFAIPGGFVDYGESLEDAVRREMKEETNLDLEDLRQFHTYSEPGRDPRFHTICTVFIAKGKGIPKAGDDAAGIKVVKLDKVQNLELAFDHKDILTDYLKYKEGKDPFK
jgi:O-acetyl-ADP-ribose deacetylase (regulator of RNase III)/ADP-ribose pyrophosphatase YjhB (NUDIX family)